MASFCLTSVEISSSCISSWARSCSQTNKINYVCVYYMKANQSCFLRTIHESFLIKLHWRLRGSLGTDLRGTKNKSWTFSWSKCFVEQSTWSGLDIWTHHANNDNVQKSLIFLNFQVRQVWMQKWMGKLHCEPLSTFWWLHWFPHSLDWSWFWWCILATPKPNPFWEVEILRNAKWISWIISWI